MQIIDYVFSHISDARLEQLAHKFPVDKKNTKIMGSLIVKGLVILILSGQKVSLRMLSLLIDAHLGIEVTYSGLSKRLKKLNVDYFKALYEELAQSCMQEMIPSDKQTLYRFDSTIITLCNKIIHGSVNVGGPNKDGYIKVTVGLKNEIPASLRFCTNKSESSEGIALVKAINEAKVTKEDVLLFDRGIQKSHAYKEFTQQGYQFVTRLNTVRRYKKISSNSIVISRDDGNTYTDDLIVHLYGNGPDTLINNNVRVIHFLNADQNPITLATNIFHLSTQEIADLYKRRWDIEIFFKFIKQNLGFKHFLSHNLNGMKVYIYMILITALLFLLYKHKTKQTGYKLVLLSFKLRVEKSFIKDLIVLAGGNPDLVKDHL